MVSGDGERARGREAAARLAWADAYTALSLADQSSHRLARANRLLEHQQRECAEHGYLLIAAAYQQLMAGDHPGAREVLAQAAGIGSRAGDRDLVAFARHLQGRALVWEGRVREGLVLLDEVMVAVVTGELSPTVAGTVYCGMIEVCQELSELRRAQEWTEALTAWCDK